MAESKHPNRLAMEACLKAFQEGDFDTLRKYFAADIEWRVPGNNPLAKTYKGPDEVFGFFGTMSQLTNGTFKTTNYEILYKEPNGANGVFIGKLTGERPGKKPLEVDLVLRIRFNKEGKFSEAADFVNHEKDWDEFWN